MEYYYASAGCWCSYDNDLICSHYYNFISNGEYWVTGFRIIKSIQ